MDETRTSREGEERFRLFVQFFSNSSSVGGTKTCQRKPWLIDVYLVQRREKERRRGIHNGFIYYQKGSKEEPPKEEQLRIILGKLVQ